MKVQINETEFKEVVYSSMTMAQASAKLGLHFNTFKRIAVKLGVYNPNQSGKGIKKDMSSITIPLTEILDGKHPSYQTYKLKNRMLREGILTNICSECGISEWNGKSISLELDHVDGVRTNHKLENLRLLCPNCHSQTDTYRSKNRI
jgi:hypothetical protein